jgi:RNA polymerase sigma factor (sigma-70 family)
MTIIPEIVCRCQQGNGKAQRIFYESSKSYLMGICRRYSRTKEEAQDLLQEVYLKIFLNIKRLEDPEKVVGWIKKITVNTAINFYHQNGKHHNLESIVEDQFNGNELNFYIDHLSDEYLISQINLLPDGCRLIFNLYEVEGYSHKEIASLTGVLEATSRSQLNYAKKILKDKLQIVGITKYVKYG